MNVLGVIPARGGSKAIPYKNIRLLDSKPLLQYTVEAAQTAKGLMRLILSTEDEVVAAVGRQCGVEVPFLRPASLARDDTPTLPVLQHAVRWLEEHGGICDAVCLLQPTAPFRQPEDIDACIELLRRNEVDAVITVVPVPAEHNPHWVFFERENGELVLSTGEAEPIPRRQDLPPAYHRDGSVYVTRRDVLMEQGSLFGSRVLGHVVDPSHRVNLDTKADWDRAEQLISSQGGPINRNECDVPA